MENQENITCKFCGKEFEPGTRYCPYCGKPQNDAVASFVNTAGTPIQGAIPTQTIYIQQPAVRRNNSYGTTGFICAIIAIFVSWVPTINWIVWLVGAICSLIGVFRKPRGLAIAGLIISFFVVILLVVAVAALAALINS